MAAPQLLAPTSAAASPADGDALEGERKQVTILFADVVGSTALIQGRDDEEAQRLLDGAVQRMVDAVHRYEGTVSRRMGVSGSGIGVEGRSGIGVGVRGTSTSGVGVSGVSTNNYGVIGSTGASGYAGLVGVGNKPGSAGFYALGVNGATAGTFNGDVVITGSLTVSGSYPKSAAVKKKDGTLARMYCVEAPESWFEDFGTATLTNGQASVALDPQFDEVVKGDDYRVFLTPIGVDCSLYVSRKEPHRFAVRSVGGGAASGTFDYRVVARRLDDVGTRLEKVDIPTMAPIDIEKLTRPSGPPGRER